MNKEIFKEKFDASIPMNEDDIKGTINKLLDFCDDGVNPRGHKNLIIVMEEMAELSQQVSKNIRGVGDRMDLIQELADVQISIYTIEEVLGITSEELEKAMAVKIDRVLSRIDQKTFK